MAKKTSKKVQNKEWWKEHKCGECANAHSWHDPSVSGVMTLAKCPHYLEGKYCVWRSKAACEKLVLLEMI